ncbi:MAG: thioredoxin [Turicibacter sp.]|nr:thioredoxin [Turicibacter sp.]
MLNLTSENFDDELAKGKTVVDFWATWCGYCKIIEPLLEELEEKCENGTRIAKVNFDEERAIADRFGITMLPTLLVFENGVEIDRKEGSQPMEVLESMI